MGYPFVLRTPFPDRGSGTRCEMYLRRRCSRRRRHRLHSFPEKAGELACDGFGRYLAMYQPLVDSLLGPPTDGNHGPHCSAFGEAWMYSALCSAKRNTCVFRVMVNTVSKRSRPVSAYTAVQPYCQEVSHAKSDVLSACPKSRLPACSALAGGTPHNKNT